MGSGPENSVVGGWAADQVAVSVAASVDPAGKKIESLTDSLQVAAGVVHDAELRLMEVIHVWSTSGEWAEHGCLSPASFLARALGVSHSEANRKLVLASKLAVWCDASSELTAALADGTVSVCDAELLLRFATDPRAELFARDLPKLIEQVPLLNRAHLRQLLTHWASLADAEIESAKPEECVPDEPVPSRLHVAVTFDDRVELSGSFDTVDGVVIRAAIDAALRLNQPEDCDHEHVETGEQDRGPSDTRPVSVRQAEALTIIANFFLQHHTKVTGSGNVVNLDVRVDLETLTGERCGGLAEVGPRATLIAVRDAIALCCNPTVTRLVTAGDSVVVDVGRATRAVSPKLEKVVRHRDRHCRFPGCAMPGTFTDVHHVVWWSKGGETNQNNLALLCRRHHRMIHHDWTVTGNPNVCLFFTNPNGKRFTTEPPPSTRTRLNMPVAIIRAG